MPVAKSSEWGTPQALFDRLDMAFLFKLDVAATTENTKCAQFLSAPDGLIEPWVDGWSWCNPPYGRGIGDWTAKAVHEQAYGHQSVLLLPARTDTVWWHRDVMAYATQIRFLVGRLRFEGATSSAPFPSALIVFGSSYPGHHLVCLSWDWREAIRQRQMRRIDKERNATG